MGAHCAPARALRAEETSWPPRLAGRSGGSHDGEAGCAGLLRAGEGGPARRQVAGTCPERPRAKGKGRAYPALAAAAAAAVAWGRGRPSCAAGSGEAPGGGAGSGRPGTRGAHARVGGARQRREAWVRGAERLAKAPPSSSALLLPLPSLPPQRLGKALPPNPARAPPHPARPRPPPRPDSAPPSPRPARAPPRPLLTPAAPGARAPGPRPRSAPVSGSSRTLASAATPLQAPPGLGSVAPAPPTPGLAPPSYARLDSALNPALDLGSGPAPTPTGARWQSRGSAKSPASV